MKRTMRSTMRELSPNRVLDPELSFVEWASKVLNGELPYEPYAELC